MVKKRYNWKSRQVVNTVVDNSATKKIQLDLQVEGHYDQSNELVLPSKKRKTKIKDEKQKITKILSKKHRKKLEKIVEKKKKKENRASLLEALSKVQATPEELTKLTSIATVQTKGLKRHYLEEQTGDKKKPKRDLQIISGEIKLNSLSGAKRRQLLEQTVDTKPNGDPNVVGFESSDSGNDSDPEPTKNEPTETEPEPKEPPIKNEPKETKTKTPTRKVLAPKPAVFVDVIRDEEIQNSRLKLPILAEEQQIMETINENPVVIIAGETGSGKTTQVPQFLYEAGYALKKQIAVTEPRRVAAIAMSKRVAQEMNLSSNEVSYLIRFEGNATEDTKIKFMTDGVLLKEVQNDFLLSQYSVVILDEAHERSVYTDILIGLLSRIVPLRVKRGDPLKLIIMSATLRVEDFTKNKRLFKKTPPVINVDSRQFPVTVHFNKRTNEDYLSESFTKVVKIHTKLPEGGVLVFVTGQQEVNSLVKKLRAKFPFKVKLNEEAEPTKLKQKKVYAPEVNLDDYDPDWSSESEEEESERPLYHAPPLWVLPLYSMLPTHKQNRVFQAPPPGCRLCVVSTNVAETSLTIPNIKYVVDSGRTKVKLYDKITGVSSYVVTWTSKASANQRAGRAGRTGPGHCYRLYSSAVFNDTLHDFCVPEIQQKPVDDLYLQMKCMSIDKVVNFPFPTAPDLLQLKTAEHRLEILGALQNSQVTPLGRAIAKFPVLPRFGKMLALSHQQDLLPYTICMVAALSVQEVLLDDAKWAALRRQWAATGNSLLLGDSMVLLRAVGAAEFANTQNRLEQFCHANGLRHKAVLEIRKLRLQLTNEIKANVPEADVVVDPALAPPTDLQAKLLRQILLAGMGDQIAKKIESEDKKFKYGYQANNMEDPVFLHSGSVLRKNLPEFVIYHEIYETNKIYMRGVTAIEPEWLPVYVPSLCNLSEPLAEPEPRLKNGKVYCTVNGTFGSQGWTLPNVEIEYPRTINYYKWFGRFLLEGLVFKKLEKYKDVLLSQPAIMVKSWAKLQPRTDAILKALLSKEAVSKQRLAEIWTDTPKFLLEEFLRWVPQSAYGEVSMMWPPLD
ncbi:probable ATP-dependent RNA helicase kurz [Tribolium castaneum]|uniref:probable ATP-dependent RNA helicase kurz n=1 Tax=Tribolium castaneum TaxID=7070 RepID=UPI0000D5661C|nr:PREDICTED: probable ATP-dependent RNA helicase kurz [Tribolium castaneum]|eukprot:XP_008191976.1 PREDICTED: probable ATP-dependent RNA helicase kurz [Tribolium castaneum]